MCELLLPALVVCEFSSRALQEMAVQRPNRLFHSGRYPSETCRELAG